MSAPPPAADPPTGHAWGVFAVKGPIGRVEIVGDRDDAVAIARDLRRVGHAVCVVGWWRTIGLDGRAFTGWTVVDACIWPVSASEQEDRRAETLLPTHAERLPHPHLSPAIGWGR